MSPGSHIGVLPTGQFTAPAQTSPKTTNAAHFKVKFIKQVVSLERKEGEGEKEGGGGGGGGGGEKEGGEGGGGGGRKGGEGRERRRGRERRKGRRLWL